MLHHAVVLLRRRDNLLRLEHVVRARLLDVHILAGLTGPDGLQRVAVVRRGDRNCVDIFVFQQLAYVDIRCRAFFPGLLKFLQALVENVLVNIAKCHDFYIWHIAVSMDVAAAPPAQPDTGNSDRVIRAGHKAGCGAHGRSGTHEKMSPIHAFFSFAMKRFMDTI